MTAIGTRPQHQQAALLEDAEWLLSFGEPWHAVAQRLGTSPSALARTLHRLGRSDLVRRHGGNRRTHR